MKKYLTVKNLIILIIMVVVIIMAVDNVYLGQSLKAETFIYEVLALAVAFTSGKVLPQTKLN